MKLVDMAKPSQVVNCKMSEQSYLKDLKVIIITDKDISSNKFSMNVVQESSSPFCFNFENSVPTWELILKLVSIDTLLLSTLDPCVEQIKQKELSYRIVNEVYTVVPDMGQNELQHDGCTQINMCKVLSILRLSLLPGIFRINISKIWILNILQEWL